MSAADNEVLVRRAIEAIWNQGDLDVADELFAATGSRPDGAAPASDGQSLTGVTRSRFSAGKIAESWTQWDRAGLLRQLGLDQEKEVH